MALPGFTGSSSFYDKHIYHGRYRIAAPNFRIYPQARPVYTYAKCIRNCYRGQGNLLNACYRKFWDYDDRVACEYRVQNYLSDCIANCDQGESDTVFSGMVLHNPIFLITRYVS